MPGRVVESVDLYYRKGSSDKVYELRLEENKNIYTVTGYYGRRDSVLKPVIKYKGPNYTEASNAYYDTKEEKQGKGYRDTDNTREIRITAKAPIKIDKKEKARFKNPEEPSSLIRNLTLGDL